MKCSLGCGADVLPGPGTFERITGWQAKATGASRKGGSDISLRETTGEIACAGCIQRLKKKLSAGQQSFDIDLSQRTEPLCAQCFAEITWITLPRSGSRMPIDRQSVRSAEPRRGWVLVKGEQGWVLRDTDLESARRGVEAGARLHRPHRLSCHGAQGLAA